MYNYKIYNLDFNNLKQKLNNSKLSKKSFFYNPEWIDACYDSKLSTIKNFFYVEIFLEKKEVLILLFQLKKMYFAKILTWLFMNDLNFVTPIIENKHKFKKNDFNNTLNKIFKELDIDLVLLDKNPKRIENIFNPLNFYKNEKSHKIPMINMKNLTWDEYYYKTYNSKTRQTDRRKKKLLSKLGKLEILVNQKLSEKEKILEFTLASKKLFLKKNKIKSKNFLKIHSKLFNAIKDDQKYICSSLKIDNNIIASIVGKIDDNNFFYLVPSYLDNSVSKYSPGRLLLKEQIKWCFDKKINYFNFGPGRFEYKNQWSNDSDRYFKILESRSLYGLLLLTFYKIKLLFN